MRAGALAGLLILAGCSAARVQSGNEAAGAPLPRPDRVVVADVTVAPGAVRVDSGIAAELRRRASGGNDAEAAAQAATATGQALTGELTDRLAAYGWPVQRLGGTPPPAGSLLVQGQITAVDEGNRTRRMLIGFGAGKSSLTAEVQLYYAEGTAPPRFIQSFRADADSGHMPGAAGTMGAGVAAQAVSAGAHALEERYRTPDAALAARVADALARAIAGYAVQRNWLPASAVP